MRRRSLDCPALDTAPRCGYSNVGEPCVGADHELDKGAQMIGAAAEHLHGGDVVGLGQCGIRDGIAGVDLGRD